MSSLSYIDNPEAEKHIIKQLSESSKLTAWEKNFIQNIKGYTDRGGFLSDRQKLILSNMWEKY